MFVNAAHGWALAARRKVLSHLTNTMISIVVALVIGTIEDPRRLSTDRLRLLDTFGGHL